MKKKLLHYLLMNAIIILFSCDDEKPKTIPVVATESVTDITTTSALVLGTINDKGNAEIEESGFVYSRVIELPTLEHEKILSPTTEEGTLSSILENLSSGTTYFIRAYAINSIGTAYGDAIEFTTDNGAPTAIELSISGELEANKEVTAVYAYQDSEGDLQSGSLIQWYVSDDAIGTGQTAIEGATALMYHIAAIYENKYISFGITPKAATGTTTGTEVKSAWLEIGAATTVTFMYNGAEVTYGIITSTLTGRKWLDRNLGAVNVASAFDDWANYGDMFQWGRRADGHQRVTRTGTGNSGFTAVNGMVGPDPVAQVNTDTPPHSQFILVYPGINWRNPANENLWQGVNGINNPCPANWRLATPQEWIAENLTNISTAYAKLKITRTGTIDGSFGDYYSATGGASYWTSATEADGRASKVVITASSVLAPFSELRSSGCVCRCIKN